MVQAKGNFTTATIYDKPFLREMVEGMLYRMRVGCPWRDLPKEFGCWNRIFQKFNRWATKNKLMMFFRMLVNEPDIEWEFIDGSIVKAHQHSAGAASEQEQGGGKSVAGKSTKYIWRQTLMACQLNLRSLAGKSMIAK